MGVAGFIGLGVALVCLLVLVDGVRALAVRERAALQDEERRARLRQNGWDV